MNEPRLSAEQWARFWRRGDVTTFRGRFGRNYDGAVLEFWQKVFATFPLTARLVDVATGNGALALLSAQYALANDRDWSITAFDFADIDPATDVADKSLLEAIETIRFVGGVAIESTGFADASFDVAVSQFGFEYAEPEAGLTELDRILDPDDARVAMMLHHSDSQILQQARDGLRQAELCESSGVTGIITDLLKRLERLAAKKRDPAADSHAEMLRGELNQRLARLDAASREFRDPSQIAFFINNSMRVFNPKRSAHLDTAGKRRMALDVADETAAYRTRMQDLIASARSDTDIEALKGGLVQRGFVIDDAAWFEFEGVAFSFTLTARRQGA